MPAHYAFMYWELNCKCVNNRFHPITSFLNISSVTKSHLLRSFSKWPSPKIWIKFTVPTLVILFLKECNDTTVDAFDWYQHRKRPAKDGYTTSKYLDLCSKSHLIIKYLEKRWCCELPKDILLNLAWGRKDLWKNRCGKCNSFIGCWWCH